MSQESVESDTSYSGTPTDRPLGSPPQRREALLRLASEKGLLTKNPTPKERAVKELSKRGHTYKSSSIGGIKKKKYRRGKKTRKSTRRIKRSS